jgi:organic hydroperoxide reductase OsmC/OhrA
MAATHEFHSELIWSGSTAVGYRTYSRDHQVVTPPASGPLPVSADAPFRGNPELINPEQLLLAAASSCQLLSYLAVAARAGLDVLGYADSATAEMPASRDRMRITRITLRPRITLAPGSDRDQARALVDTAHDECYIANTINAEVIIEARFEVAS